MIFVLSYNRLLYPDSLKETGGRLLRGKQFKLLCRVNQGDQNCIFLPDTCDFTKFTVSNSLYTQKSVIFANAAL